MSALPREYEARAIAQLAALHENDEWSDTSRTVQAWVRRDGRNREPVEPKPARAQVRSTKGIRPPQARKPAELVESESMVRRRSGGRCEHPLGCCAVAVVVHHRQGRGFAGCHHPELLLHLCEAHHSWTHAHPAESYANGAMLKRNGASE